MMLSIIIPVKNAQRTLSTCLANIKNIEIPHEVIIVNDHSTDESLQNIHAHVCKIVTLEKSTGPGAARNAGAKASQGNILLFIDSDIYTSGENIKKSYDEFLENNYICAISAYSYNSNLDFISRYYNNYITYKFTDRTTTNIFFSSYAMVKKDYFIPFSEHLKTLEDAAMGHQLVHAGHAIHIFSSMAVLHQKEINLIGLAQQFFNRSRDAAILSWSLFRQDRPLKDDTVKNCMRISLILLPLICFLSPFSRFAFYLFIPLIAVNTFYFLYILRLEGIGGLSKSIILYFYTIVCGDIGIACGLLKVLHYECMAPFKIRKTPLI